MLNKGPGKAEVIAGSGVVNIFKNVGNLHQLVTAF